MEQQHISIKDFYYELPVDRIAQYPLAERDLSKLLIYKDGDISQLQYASIADVLPNNSLLFFNNTKVIPARLFFKTDTDKDIELFCLEPISNHTDVYANMLEQGSSTWKCLVGGAAKWKQQYVFLNHPDLQIKAEIKERLQGAFIVEFTWGPAEKTFAEVLQIAGAMPIPPYLKRATEELDLERYQTIYADKEGSVAAPTAGLHFTNSVFQKLKAKQIEPTYVTLHVGAGTFKPVKSETMAEHDMHAEYIDVPLSTIEYLFKNLHKPITAVGTTSLRTLESLFWIGEKISREPSLKAQDLQVNQWQPYESTAVISSQEALTCIINYLKKHQLNTLYAKTSLLIIPGNLLFHHSFLLMTESFPPENQMYHPAALSILPV
jgi:S-adenosylmethionine:tRNA ribosyltransferase-isomerase